jgi:hypothetical protein
MSCILSSIDGEGDPRNLVVIFDLISFILVKYCAKNSEINNQFVVDIFDKISQYFPINFKPPKDDRFKITPANL